MPKGPPLQDPRIPTFSHTGGSSFSSDHQSMYIFSQHMLCAGFPPQLLVKVTLGYWDKGWGISCCEQLIHSINYNALMAIWRSILRETDLRWVRSSLCLRPPANYWWLLFWEFLFRLYHFISNVISQNVILLQLVCILLFLTSNFVNIICSSLMYSYIL